MSNQRFCNFSFLKFSNFSKNISIISEKSTHHFQPQPLIIQTFFISSISFSEKLYFKIFSIVLIFFIF